MPGKGKRALGAGNNYCHCCYDYQHDLLGFTQPMSVDKNGLLWRLVLKGAQAQAGRGRGYSCGRSKLVPPPRGSRLLEEASRTQLHDNHIAPIGATITNAVSANIWAAAAGGRVLGNIPPSTRAPDPELVRPLSAGEQRFSRRGWRPPDRAARGSSARQVQPPARARPT